MSKRERLDECLFLRLSRSELERLEAVVARVPLTTKHGLAREAMRRGLDLICANPSILISDPQVNG